MARVRFIIIVTGLGLVVFRNGGISRIAPKNRFLSPKLSSRREGEGVLNSLSKREGLRPGVQSSPF